jgi:hypothetical protein
MPASQRFQAPLLLLILALPLAIVATAADLGLPWDWFWGWGALSFLLLVIPGMALAIRGLSLSPKPGHPFDTHRFERQGRTMLMATAFVIGAVALLIAVALSSTGGLLIVAVAALWILLWTPPWLRRVQVETSVLIQRDPAAVFTFVADSQNDPLYSPTVISVEKITDGPVGAGTQFRIKMQLTPTTTVDGICEIVDYEPNRRMTSRVTTGATPNLSIATLTPADGGTLLSGRLETEVSFSLALAGMALRIPQATRRMVAASQPSLIKLKQILENTDSGPAAP